MTADGGTIAFLRAYLLGASTAGTDDGPDLPDDLVPLVQRTFVLAARRVFTPQWTRPDVVRYVAGVRQALSERPRLIDARAAEYELRRALGDDAAPASAPEAAAAAQVVLLKAMVIQLGLDDDGTRELLAQASSLLAAQHGCP